MKNILQGPEYLYCSQTLLEFEDVQTISGVLQNQLLLEPKLKKHPNQIPDQKAAEWTGYWQSRFWKSLFSIFKCLNL